MKSKNFYPPYHYFICPECDKDKEMSGKEMMVHLKEVHKIKNLEGNRELLMHINKKPRHSSTYKWTIEGKEIYEYYG